MRRYFGTDGIRGRANSWPMTAETALKVGMAAGSLYTRAGQRQRVVIGKDTRRSGYMIEQALTAGFLSVGMDVFLVGPVPTPAVGMLARSMRADLGVMISASHNPFQDNGIKFFGPDGFKLADEIEAEMEALLDSGKIDSIRPTALDIGKTVKMEDARGRYTQFVKNVFDPRLGLDGLKIVVDCANGAAYKVAPTIF